MRPGNEAIRIVFLSGRRGKAINMTLSKNLMHSNAHIKGYYNVHVGQEFFSSSASWNKILLIALVYHSPPCHGSLLPGKGKLLELWQ